MRRRIPTIHESPETLKARYMVEPHARKKQRLQMLYLLQTQRAKTMRDVAHHLQMHRVTIGYWLRVYEQTGLAGLLGINPHPGRPLSLSQPVLERLKMYLEIPGYFNSYKEIHAWLCETFQLNISYKAVHKIVRYVLKVQLKPSRQGQTVPAEDGIALEHAGHEALYPASV